MAGTASLPGSLAVVDTQGLTTTLDFPAGAVTETTTKEVGDDARQPHQSADDDQDDQLARKLPTEHGRADEAVEVGEDAGAVPADELVALRQVEELTPTS